jgi:hypothetical protein
MYLETRFPLPDAQGYVEHPLLWRLVEPNAEVKIGIEVVSYASFEMYFHTSTTSPLNGL